MCPESLSALFVKPMRSHNPQQETRRLLDGRIALEIQSLELHPRRTGRFALSKIAQPFRFAEIAHTSPLAEGPRQADRPNIACPATPREGPSQFRKSPPPTNEPEAVPDTSQENPRVQARRPCGRTPSPAPKPARSRKRLPRRKPMRLHGSPPRLAASRART